MSSKQMSPVMRLLLLLVAVLGHSGSSWGGTEEKKNKEVNMHRYDTYLLFFN